MVDYLQKTTLLNLGTIELYGSNDPYRREPRSPRKSRQPSGGKIPALYSLLVEFVLLYNEITNQIYEDYNLLVFSLKTKSTYVQHCHSVVCLFPCLTTVGQFSCL